MSNLPPGCTQQMCDEAQPGYWDPPQQWFECDACEGAGEVYSGRMSHMVDSATIDPPEPVMETCGKCNGDGGWIDDVESDDGVGR